MYNNLIPLLLVLYFSEGNIMRYLILLLTFLLTVNFSVVANQQTLSPYQVIEQTGGKLFARISSSQQELNKFPDLMREIVEQELMPVIDYKYASYKVLGKNLKKTTKPQREKFVASMQHYLVRTYASALNQYKNQQVVYVPGKVSPNAKAASVNVKIIDSNKPTIGLTFQMRKNKKTQQWKAYDLVVEGISLLTSKQAEFNSRIAKYGIDQVTTELAALSK